MNRLLTFVSTLQISLAYKYVYWSGAPLVLANSANDISSREHKECIAEVRFHDLGGREFTTSVPSCLDVEELWNIVRIEWGLQDVALSMSEWKLELGVHVLEEPFVQPLLSFEGDEPVSILVLRKVKHVFSVSQITPDIDIDANVCIALEVVVASVSDGGTEVVAGDETGIVTIAFDATQIADIRNDIGDIAVGHALEVQRAYVVMRDGRIRLCVRHHSALKRHFGDRVICPNMGNDISSIEYEHVGITPDVTHPKTPITNALLVGPRGGSQRRRRF